MNTIFKKGVLKLRKLNIRTLWFNFHYFPMRVAIKLPVFISRRSCFYNLKGTVEILGKIKTGMIELGYEDVPIFDKKNSRFIWDVKGKVVFEKNCVLGHGCKIRVLPTGELFFGANSKTTAETAFVTRKKISIGQDTLLSWDILLMDTDFHPVFDENNNLINPDREIIIGNKVWIGCRSTILKGAVIPSNVIIAANSVVTKKIDREFTIYGGQSELSRIKEFRNWEV